MKNIPLLYFVFSLGWIFFSEMLINQLEITAKLYEILQTGKGLLFVGFTTFLIYIIIKKHEALKTLEEKEQELSSLINAMPDFVCFKDGEGRWVRVNQFGKDLYHLNHINYYGKTDAELAEVSPFFKDAFLYCIQSDKEAWQINGTSRCEESFHVPSGELKTFDVIKVPLFFSNGERKGLVTIGRDITQQKNAETMLLQKEKLSVVGELAAGIAHEIRNPLTSIKGFVQLMKESDNSSTNRYDIILSELDRINQIVGEMLVLSKPQSVIHKSFNINDMIKYVVNLTSHEALMYNVQLEVRDKVQDTYIKGDINQLIQVFINILKNSIDAMPKGGRILFTAEKLNGNVEFKIEDTGVGIPEERLERIGEPFFTLKEKGMGLGLTVSNKIIHEHKGSMEIESEVGIGTTVTVKIPVYQEEK
ncbi:PAS domain-containing protein [Bacillus luteolus]|uniref:histidine kinase n=2 Tax=Litchfieldia luteola TaxID=682179 RepID=A0ABR9QKG3_9BACI|nr:PAS domain-containing protein [Cytobacillus luteolus]